MTTEPSPEENVARALATYQEAATAAKQAAAEPGTSLVPAGGADQAAALKIDLVEQRAAVLRAQQTAEAARGELRKAIDEQKRAIEAQMRKLEAELAPVMKKARLLGDGIDALNIYLGRDEEIEELRDGERAPADEVISVRQLVLSMSEESLIGVDQDGMDYKNIADFCDWLLRDPNHLDQVLPERKGVVALVPRRDEKDYGNPWENAGKNQANQHTYWLIRNGEALYLTTTEFVVGTTTVPTAREFTSLFERREFGGEVRPLEPGTREWAKAEELADARTRHYMKVALLLQGLLDRTAVFHPHAGASFLDQRDYDAGKVRVIADAENALGTGRPSFAAWQRDLMKRVEVGMRVVGAFSSRMELYGSRDRLAEVYPKGATPQNNVAYVLQSTQREYFDFQFSFDRQDELWSVERGYYKPQRKATGYIDRNDRWLVPIDLVTIEDLNYYLHSRSERHNYLDMIPTIRAAFAVKEVEAAEEAPFRAALIGRLASAGFVTPDSLADELIAWYKTGNRWHRALDANDAKAAKLILAEAKRRAAGTDTEVVEQLRAEHAAAIVIARRTSDWIVVEPQPRAYAAAAENVYAITHVHGLRGALRETREWQALRRSQVSRWTIAWQADAWTEWVLDPETGVYLTDDDLDFVIRRTRETYPATFQIRVRPGKTGKYDNRADFFVAVDGAATPSASIVIDTTGGDLRVTPRNPFGGDWTHTETPEWETRYSNVNPVANTIWQDDDRIAELRTRWETWAEGQRVLRTQNETTRRLIRQIEQAWEAAELEKIRLRFIEDFGDESLWEGHSKSVRVPSFPYVNHAPKWKHEKPSHLGKVVSALVARGVTDLSGVTVAGAAKRIGHDVDLIPADLHELRWPAAS